MIYIFFSSDKNEVCKKEKYLYFNRTTSYNIILSEVAYTVRQFI